MTDRETDHAARTFSDGFAKKLFIVTIAGAAIFIGSVIVFILN